MTGISTDIAIVGAGMAGASLAALIGDRARVLLIERESQPGYHATGRSAAFWSESYGGPGVQPLTTASGPWLDRHGFLGPRGCVHIAETVGELDAIRHDLTLGGVAHHDMDRSALRSTIPGLRPAFAHGLAEPTCRDIDVAAMHAHMLARVRRAGGELWCDADVRGAARDGGGWRIETRRGMVRSSVLVNAAGAWAGALAVMARALPIAIHPYRRTMIQLAVDPAPMPTLPLVMDARGRFYFKPEAGGRLWLSPHDETAVDPHDVAPEEIDQARAIDRLETTVDWRILRRERAWAGLRSFAPDRLPVYGFDRHAPGFFWFAGQGGFGIQTAPAAAMLATHLLLGTTPDEAIGAIDPTRYAPGRFF